MWGSTWWPQQNTMWLLSDRLLLGLTCGALLAQQGKRVIVLEQHIAPKGYAASQKRLLLGRT